MKILTSFRHPVLEKCLRKIPGVEWVDVEIGELKKAAATGAKADCVLIQAADDHINLQRPTIISDGTLGPSRMTDRWRDALQNPFVKAIVFNTAEQIWTWQVPANRCTVIPRGVDLGDLPIWKGGDKIVISAVNLFKSRGPQTGYELWEKATRTLPRCLYGWGNEDIGSLGEGVYGSLRHAVLGKRLSECNVFLNTTLISAAPNALIEAMVVGIPIVSTKTFFSYSQLGDRGFISNDPVALRVRLIELLNDPESMREAGLRNRAMAKEIFNMDTCVHRWKQLLEEVL